MITKVTVTVLLAIVTCTGAELPTAPSASVTKRDLALASASVAGAAFDAWTTSHNISRGCTELNPILDARPSAARIWATESALTGAQLFAAWELKRHGHAGIAAFMLGGAAAEHVFAGVHNLQQVCK